jgi:hypothetical protein
MTSGDLHPADRDAIRRRAREIAAAAPRPTDEQINTLRRWFGPRTTPRGRGRAA